MDVSSIGAVTAASPGNPRATAQGGADPATQALQKADQRDRVSVEVSAVGRLKSSISEVRSAAAALSDKNQTTTDAGVTRATKAFVKAFNNAARTAGANAGGQGLLAGSGANAAKSDLLGIASADATAASDLKKIGITQQSDGTLALDARKFEAALQTRSDAVRSTLSTIGQQADQAATRELTATSTNDKPVAAPDTRARNLENQQTDQQAQTAATQQTTSAQTADINKSQNNLNTGAAAYQRVFSL